MKILPIIIEYLLLLLPMLVHLGVDYKGIVRHWLNAIYVLLLAALVGFFLPGYFWQGAFYALTLHFCFFDPIYNLIKGHAWNYHGSVDNPKRAFTDKCWAYLQNPLAEIFVRVWMLLVGIGIYYHLDWIIGN
jgi:hypothetical protein